MTTQGPRPDTREKSQRFQAVQKQPFNRAAGLHPRAAWYTDMLPSSFAVAALLQNEAAARLLPHYCNINKLSFCCFGLLNGIPVFQ